MNDKVEKIYPPAEPIRFGSSESNFSIAGLFIGAAVGAAYTVTTGGNKTDALVNIGIGAVGGYGIGFAVDQLSPEAQERVVSDAVKMALAVGNSNMPRFLAPSDVKPSFSLPILPDEVNHYE